MAKIVTFGELMIRLQPYHYERFVQADCLEFTSRYRWRITDRTRRL